MIHKQNNVVSFNGKKMPLVDAVNLATELIAQQKFKECEPLAKQLVHFFPNLDSGHQILGIALGEQGQYAEAVDACRKAVALNPDSPNHKNSLANYLVEQNEFKEAEALYLEALATDPNYPDAIYNLAKLFLTQQRYPEAESYFQKALLLAPNKSEVYQNLGACKYNQGLYGQALLWFRLADNHKPDDPDIVYNMAHCLMEMYKIDEAIELFNQTLELDNYRYDVLHFLATCHYRKYDFKVAEDFGLAYLNHLNKVEDKSINLLSAKMFLAGIYKAQGRHLEAIEEHKEIIEGFPDQSIPFNNMLLDCAYTDQISKNELIDLHHKFSDRYEKGMVLRSHANTKERSRKLRIGYVSADYFNHAVAYLALPLIARHDKTNFEIFCYYNNKMYSPITHQFMRNSIWRQVDTMTDDELADKIQEDQIDILIDLSGHTGHNRLLTFAKKPAPIQASWLGYPFSTGIKAIDYRIVDRFIEDDSPDNQTTGEKLFFLDKCFAAYRPCIAYPDRIYSGELDIRPTPALKNGFITFGCCNNIAKITDHTVALWAAILNKCQNSKLLLELNDPEQPLVKGKIEARFAQHGISMDRVILSDRQKNKQYSLYHDIDIVLDPTPCNGGNTTCDSLWMSVPMVSLVGDRYMSKMGLTFLTNIGHPEWLAYTDQEYIDIACEMAADVNKLNDIRSVLRDEVEHSPLMDEVGFARRMENAYRQMWTEWCNQEETGESVKGESVKQQAQQHVPAKTKEIKGSIAKVSYAPNSPVDLAAAHLLQLYQKEAWEELAKQANVFLTKYPDEKHDGVLHLKGVALAGLHQFELAKESLDAAIELAPNEPSYYNSLGNYFLNITDYSSAEETYRKALELDPNLIQAIHNLGVTLFNRAQTISLASSEANTWLDQAANFFQHTIDLDASHLHAWNNLCSLQMYRNRKNEAEVAVRRALRIDPDFVPALNNLATLLYFKDKYDEAIKTLEHAFEISPTEAVVVHNLANLYAKVARIDDAVRLSKMAVELDPTNLEFRQSLLLNIVYYDKMDVSERMEHYAAFSNSLPRQQNYLHLNDPVASRKIRLGFVSGDFKTHSTSYSTFPLFELINKSDFELFFYYNGDQYDNITARFQHDYADEWRNTRGISYDVMDALVRDDQIDILIDLSGHTGHSFLPAFASKPAPVQVTWLGYPETTGLAEVDYRITDSVAHPDTPEVQKTFTEQLYRLPEGVPFAVYRPYVANPERHHMHVFNVQPTPVLKNGFVTFGSGSSIIRLNDYTIRLWAAVMNRVEGSKLMLDCKSIPAIVLEKFESYGIGRERIATLGRNPSLQYRFYHEIDIALDAFPCNGGTTSFDTLWMGVPLVSRAGDRFASRIGASLLTHLGHPEWAAETDEMFVETAVALSKDVVQLDQLRQSIRPMMQSSSLMDEVKFTRAFEQALRQMWQTWCASSEAAQVRDYLEQKEMLSLSANLVERAEYAMAWEAYLSILAKWPTCGEALYGAGLAALLQNQPGSAHPILARAAQALQAQEAEVSLQADCLASLGHAALLLGNENEAAAHFHHSLAMKDSPTTQEWLNMIPNAATKIN